MLNWAFLVSTLDFSFWSYPDGSASAWSGKKAGTVTATWCKPDIGTLVATPVRGTYTPVAA